MKYVGKKYDVWKFVNFQAGKHRHLGKVHPKFSLKSSDRFLDKWSRFLMLQEVRFNSVGGVGGRERDFFKKGKQKMSIPIPSRYAIFTYIYPKNQPNVSRYIIHGWYGIYP